MCEKFFTFADPDGNRGEVVITSPRTCTLSNVYVLPPERTVARHDVVMASEGGRLLGRLVAAGDHPTDVVAYAVTDITLGEECVEASLIRGMEIVILSPLSRELACVVLCATMRVSFIAKTNSELLGFLVALWN